MGPKPGSRRDKRVPVNCGGRWPEGASGRCQPLADGRKVPATCRYGASGLQRFQSASTLTRDFFHFYATGAISRRCTRMRRPRCILSTEVYFVTVRTVDEQFALSPHACPGAWRLVEPGIHIDHETRQRMLLRGQACVRETEAMTQQIADVEQGRSPCPEVSYSAFTDSVPNIIGSWLARAVRHYRVKLYGFVWMSNHVHLLVQAPEGNFTEFMAYLNGQIAREINRFLRRQHQLWARRYAIGQVLDEPAELERLLYILTNPAKAGIVDSIEQWQGLSSAPFLLEGKQQRFLCFDRSRWHRAGRPDIITPYLSTVELEHTVLPQRQKYGAAENQAYWRQMLKEQQRALANADFQRGADGPAEKLRWRGEVALRVPTDRPASPKRSPQPLCHTTVPAMFRVFARWFRLFVEVCRKRAREYMQGDVEVVFPPGAFAPSRFPRARYPEADDGEGLPCLKRALVHRAVSG